MRSNESQRIRAVRRHAGVVPLGRRARAGTVGVVVECRRRHARALRVGRLAGVPPGRRLGIARGPVRDRHSLSFRRHVEEGDPMTATRARYRVVALATTLAMVTYLDRVAIGTLAPGIRRDLGLTAVQMGWVFTVFQLAYGLFEVPTGRWADRVGTRSVHGAHRDLVVGVDRGNGGGVQLSRSCSWCGSSSASARRARGPVWRGRSRGGFRAASADARRASSSPARTWSPA